MIAIDSENNTKLHLTRGDRVDNLSFNFPILEDGEIKDYIFKKGDKISFIVKEKKGYDKQEVFRKEFFVEKETKNPIIKLTGEETKWGDIKNKKTIYWYDIVLNDDITILGYDDEGAKEIYLYPEGGEK